MLFSYYQHTYAFFRYSFPWICRFLYIYLPKLVCIMDEIWKPIAGYEGIYEFNGVNKVRSVERTVMRNNGRPQHFRGRVLKCGKKSDNRQFVCLYDTSNGRSKTFLIHQLIWMYHNNKSIPEGYDIHHIDRNCMNNSIDNLQLLPKEEHVKLHQNDKGKSVQALDKDGNVVFEFTSTKEASRHGFDQSAVSKCCNGEPYYKTHKGYKWEWAS